MLRSDAAGNALGAGRLKRMIRYTSLAVALVVAGCATKDDVDDLALDETPAEVMFNEALALRAAGDVEDAANKFSELDRVYPYSEFARKSLINIAYLNFKMGNHSEAIAAAERFTTLYPGNEDSAYALFIIGESYFRQIPDVGRDQAVTGKALQAMREVIQRYPDSEYTKQARQRVRATEDQLAGKEMEVGRYYLTRRNYLASINRFKVVVTNYQTTRHVEEALYRLTESYYALGVVNEAQTAAAVLGHNFPQSEWYQDAYSLLQKGGLEPQESKGSWLSRAFGNMKLL
ncbi:Outer membrane protein assembly factor BamD precursor [Pseudovibrio axinellae]|uniref:Outer membrane protein assembly factor BamD n=1 Tax=Pseudovibrio axinellae TaxID=989403 RepID=A0A161V906_9HYPH|nr:outer membrane protein assembly factor BamD [Pseudovibrio axinellae]KZL21479.1 Outer membrane protein assembly factor BamD precursor [Pseudovibrio axinellae]SER06648.1 Beta-barrel assembly machine subunit BamD [Pseudovibrio axinellae]